MNTVVVQARQWPAGEVPEARNAAVVERTLTWDGREVALVGSGKRFPKPSLATIRGLQNYGWLVESGVFGGSRLDIPSSEMRRALVVLELADHV